jgi:hypothetical protein
MGRKSLLLDKFFRFLQRLLCGSEIAACQRELCQIHIPYDQQIRLLPGLRDA